MRMYFFVNMYLSSIQKGIQAGHAAERYAYSFGLTEQYKDYIENYGTWIVLNGGSSTHAVSFETGSMNKISQVLIDNKINYASFTEPFLEDCLTAICFLAPEQVYNREDYPDFKDFLIGIHPECSKYAGEYLKVTYDEEYESWINNVMGSYENAMLRELVTGAHLAI